MSSLHLATILEKNDINIESELKYLEIDKIYLSLNNKSILLYLKADEIISYKLLDDALKLLTEKIEDIFEIEYKIKYKIDLAIDDKFNENIKYIIKKNIPSSLAWIDSIKINFNSNTLLLYVNSEIEYSTLIDREVDKLIETVVGYELNKKINVKIKLDDESCSIVNSDDHNKIKIEEEIKLLNSLTINIDAKKDTPKKSNEFNGKSKNEFANGVLFGKDIKEESMKLKDINSNSGNVTVEGEIFDLEIKEIKGNKKIYMISISDYTNSITSKVFVNPKQEESIKDAVKKGLYVKINGDVIYDTFARTLVIMIKGIKTISKPSRDDNFKEKRVELHVHTKMSDMDGVSSFEDIAKRVANWGHKALAITDHGVVQGFPEAMSAGKKYGIKMLYGLEGYLIDDNNLIVTNEKGQDIDCEYVVFDIETTGFSPINDKITEIGAVKIKDGLVIDTYSQLINPEKLIPEKVVELTGITNESVVDKPKIEEVFNDFINFIGDSVLVAHNATFDMGFIKANGSRLGYTIKNTVIDTLTLSRNLFKELKSHKLNIIAKHLGVNLKNHHRAVDDSKATGEILIKCIDLLKEKGAIKLIDIDSIFAENINYKAGRPNHIIIFAKNYKGLKNLYKLVSEAHIKYYYRQPRIPKSILMKYREGLILGSACEAGELFRGILENKDQSQIEEIANFYDYLEIQPIDNNMFLVEDGKVDSIEELMNINRKIVTLGEKLNKPVVATCDVHFLDSHDEVFRRILMAGKGFKDADKQAPLYLKTTEEMIKEFKYLGEDKAYEVVVKNTNIIADMIEEMLPIPDGTFPPIIEGSENELREITYKKATDIYGNPLPEIVKSRLDRELNSIISNGYAVMYIISEKLVKKSLSDGYLVGSRGSVGSSFVATMSGITDVNPLPPHYVCNNCKNSEFITDGSIGSGIDMEDKNCPKCGSSYIKDGHDIPFEVFLGFEGDKEPDIDLNFAGEYQSVAHHYVEELFGEGHVYRAGTIGTIAEKTAYGFVKKYYEEKNTPLNNAEANRLVKGCTGVKRTSGQHPGGVMVVPRDKEVYDFSPIQYPANDSSSGVITTHFDYHSISGRILKLDILGHDTPSIIRMLEDLTNVDIQDVSLNDKQTMKIFTTTESLGISKEDINSEVGTFGIPEFGTKFVRQMLIDTQPTTFDELVRISGLSHGTDVWLNNAQDLVRNGVTTLKSVIATRDDIMLYLIYNGLDKKRSFTIMEKVRKGKGLTEDDENYMRENDIPEWYIEACNKIKYMFPKAHAVAYVTMSFRIAYFKVHYPEAFYATYFTTKATDFDADLIVKGKVVIKEKIEELESMGNNKTAKEKNLLTVLEVALEMYARGYKIQKVDLYKADSDKFLLDANGIIPPLKSLQGVGENAARSIVESRKEGDFISIEDLTKRAKINKTAIEALKNHGCLDGMSESNQLSLFNI